MIRHLLKLVWNRKRAHGLLILEIGISFLVVFAVVAAAVYFGGHWLSPLGFDRAQVWVVQIGTDVDAGDDTALATEQRETFELLLRELEALPEVVEAAGADAVPYDGSITTSIHSLEGGALVEYHSSRVGLGYIEALRIPIVRGRSFAEEDHAQPWTPAIIDRELGRRWFGEADPIGRTPPFEKREPGEEEVRVVGLVDDYRKGGELEAPTSFALFLRKLSDPGPDSFDKIVLGLAGPPDAGFEERLLGQLRGLAPHWSFDIRSLESMRDRQMTMSIASMVALGVIALSLLLMVALGLVGVMWQNVTQRTREIGLRRACGASAGAIRRQVLIEMLLMAGIGVAVGAAVVVQLPILGWFAGLNGRTLALGLVGSAAAMVLLTLACGVYPSRLATAIHPAEALHHD